MKNTIIKLALQITMIIFLALIFFYYPKCNKMTTIFFIGFILNDCLWLIAQINTQYKEKKLRQKQERALTFREVYAGGK